MQRMRPVNEKVVRRQRRRRRLFLWRAAVCFCLFSLLFAAVKGTEAVVKTISGFHSDSSASVRVSSGQTPPASSFVPAAASAGKASLPSASRPSSRASSAPPASRAPKNWFSDALLIGDSRTEGLRNYDGLPGATYYAVKGLMVDTVYTKRVIADGGSRKTVMQAACGHSFGKIYVMLGINELGWSSMQSFVSDYLKMVKDLKKSHPAARIYLQANFPVSAKKSAESPVYKNDKIASYNEAIQKIAKQEKVVFLNTAEAVSADGILPDDASVDGIHLTAAYCAKWCDYLKAHAQ